MKRILAICFVLYCSGWALARNVDLSTVPKRNTVQLTIYNSEDLTLVRETRLVTFKKGVNPLQFSWANTLIDPSSVQLKFLSAADKLDVLDTTFPHDKPQMLYWNVQSEIDGQATIQITYFTSGITWNADYLAIADPQEQKLSYEGFVRIHNNSGEEYEDAQVRLVVGTINLVEKIAQLGRMTYAEAEEILKEQTREATGKKREAMLSFADRADSRGGGGGGDQGQAKQIIKEGLSEYFIFTIEGTETIPNGWSKRLRAVESDAAPVKIQYRYRPREYGDQLVRMYLLTNNKDAKLGQSPLPDGVVRVFRQNGKGGLSYLAQQSLKYIPIGQKIEINLGPDPEVLFELIPQRAWRDNIWLSWSGGRIVRRVDDGAIDFDINASVVGWDDHLLYNQQVRNYSAKDIEIEVRRSYGGHVEFVADLPQQQLFDFNTVQYNLKVPAGQRVQAMHQILTHKGRNARQASVTLRQQPADR
jgi:hypothetical protein